MHGSTTKALLECVEDGDINSELFFKKHPLCDSLKQDLVTLQRMGYIALDYGDNTIVQIAANQKLLDLLKEDH